MGGPSRGDSLVSLATSSSVPSSASLAAPWLVYCPAGMAPEDTACTYVDCPAYSNSSASFTGMAVALGLHGGLRVLLVHWSALALIVVC